MWYVTESRIKKVYDAAISVFYCTKLQYLTPSIDEE